MVSAMMLIVVWERRPCFDVLSKKPQRKSDRGATLPSLLKQIKQGLKNAPRCFQSRCRSALFFLAAIFSATAYGIMNGLMLATPLAMQQYEIEFPAIARTIQLHVLAMYLPSFFTGSLIDRFGVHKVLAVGVVILMLSAGVHFISAIP